MVTIVELAKGSLWQKSAKTSGRRIMVHYAGFPNPTWEFDSLLPHFMMTKLIKSRYGVNRLITEEADGSLTIEGESLFYRCSGNEKDLEMFDFEGGPFLMVGDPMMEFEGTIKSIELLESKDNNVRIKVRCE